LPLSFLPLRCLYQPKESLANLLFFYKDNSVGDRTMSTIVALATGQNLAAIALIRLTGEDAHTLALQFVHLKHPRTPPKMRTAIFGNLYVDGNELDQVLLTLFAAPASYTGEDMAEIACHGSPYIVQTILTALVRAGAQPAEPGEFTYRAYSNGKLDLTQAEAVNELINAHTATQHRTALLQLEGALTRKIGSLREKLLALSSLIELEIDFSDQDVEFVPREQLLALTKELEDELTQLCSSFRNGEAIQNGLPITIAGAPNVGKSALLNILLGQERAIVSDIPGTTRDTIQGEILVNGITIRFTDTAGLRSTSDTIEQLGIERTRQSLATSPLAILLVDVSTKNQRVEILEAFRQLIQLLPPKASPLLLLSKVDLISSSEAQMLLKSIHDEFTAYTISLWSAKTLEGKENIYTWLEQKTNELLPSQSGFVLTNIRHFRALSRAKEEILLLQTAIAAGYSSDLLAVHLRQTRHLLGEIVGEIPTEDILHNIFSHFCIGK
jgi:tRNA modification GTPase trmE